MKYHIETERLILREARPEDAEGFWQLDSDPEVHRYLGNQPLTRMEQVHEIIQFLQKQYADFGIARWSAIEKRSGKFIGWCGLKWNTEELNGHQNFHDLGYRFIREYWGRGFAQESSKAVLAYGFQEMKLDSIYAAAEIPNAASNAVLQKLGFVQGNTFEFDGEACYWYELHQCDWKNQ